MFQLAKNCGYGLAVVSYLIVSSGADEDKSMAKIFIEMNVKRDVSKCFTGTIISNCKNDFTCRE